MVQYPRASYSRVSITPISEGPGEGAVNENVRQSQPGERVTLLELWPSDRRCGQTFGTQQGRRQGNK